MGNIVFDVINIDIILTGTCLIDVIIMDAIIIVPGVRNSSGRHGGVAGAARHKKTTDHIQKNNHIRKNNMIKKHIRKPQHEKNK